MFYIYCLESKVNKQFYIGYTLDLRKRLVEHSQKLNASTKRYVPWRLIYYEACVNKSDAIRREKYLKTTQGGRLLKRRLKDYLYVTRKHLTN
jgi:putative endonuclease